MAKRRFFISPNQAFWTMIGILLGLSAYFVTNVESQRRQWRSKSKEVEVKSGEIVQVLQVIDGDEVSVQTAQGPIVVRLLGIKAFKPNINEPGLAAMGAACKRALQQAIKNKQITVEFKEAKKDKAKRLLAYLHAGGKDIGLLIVRAGYALVFTRYSFSREKLYLAAELEAKTRARGIWGNPKAEIRATALKAAWEAQRSDD